MRASRCLLKGSDSNITLAFQRKGTGQFHFFGTTRIGLNAANNIIISGAAAGSGPTFDAAGSDTNIDIAFNPKGTGTMRFGTFTSNADTAITGYVTIKDSGGTSRKLAVIA